MKKLVSVLMISSIANLAHAWTDAGVNYFQPIAAYEALKETDTNLSKDDNQAPNNKIQKDFKVITNIQCDSCSNKNVYESKHEVKEFEDIISHDKLYALLRANDAISPESLNHAEFVMLMREMHRINQNLERLLGKDQRHSHTAVRTTRFRAIPKIDIPQMKTNGGGLEIFANPNQSGGNMDG